jgi:thioredoxin-like negative regulator of GroEL
MNYYEKMEQLKSVLEQIEEAWEEDGRCARAYVDLTEGRLWWKRASHKWGLRYQAPGNDGSTIALTKAPMEIRFKATMLLPQLDDEIEKRMAAQDRDLDAALEIAKDLLQRTTDE